VTPAAARASTDPTHGATTPLVAPTVAVFSDELAYTLRMTDRDLPSHASAMRVAAEIRLLNPELFDQRRGIIRHLLERQRLTPQRRVLVPLQFDRDHLPGLRQRCHQRCHQPDRHQSAVQDHQRLSGTMNLVVELEPID
jgi:hypothetical protein